MALETDSEAYWTKELSFQIYYARTYELAWLQYLGSLPSAAQAIVNLEYYYSHFGVVYEQSIASSLATLTDTTIPGMADAVRAIPGSIQDLSKTGVRDLSLTLGNFNQSLVLGLANIIDGIDDNTRITGGALNALVQAVGPALKTLIESPDIDLKLDGEVKRSLVKWLGDQTASGPGGWFMEIVTTVTRELGKVIVDSVRQAVAELHKPVEAVVLPAVASIFEEYRHSVSVPGEVRPGDYPDLALKAFDAALRMGALAHGFGAIVELLHPTKQIGLAHLAAGLSDAAGFEPVVRAALGRQLDFSLGRAAEMHARERYRSVWAGISDFVDMWLEGRISAERVRERLRVEGWPEDQIIAFMGTGEEDPAAVPYREARPTDLAYVYEDITTPDAWILRQLMQSGFHREDAQRLMLGLRRRSMRTYTSGYVSELVGAFGDGLLSEQALRDYLRSLDLRQEAEDRIVNRATMSYYRQTAKDLLAVYRDMVDKSLISITDFRSAAAAFGFQEHTIAAEVARLDARARGRLLVEEQREAEAAVREFQRLLGTEYAERVRRGLVTSDAMESALVLAGIEPAQAAAMARIAAIRQIPALKLPEAMTPEAQAQKVKELLTRAALERVKDVWMSAETAVAYLVSLGTPQGEAEAEVALAVAQGLKPPKIPAPPKEAPEIREARRNRTQAAVAAFQAGEFEEAELLKRLQGLGHAAAVAVSLVEQEATERRLRLQREAEREREKVLAEVQKLEQDLILELVVKRLLEPEEATAALISIGVVPQEAELLVQRALLKAGVQVG